MSPKKLLRYKDACSDLKDFGEGLRFLRAIDEVEPDKLAPKNAIKKVILCSGQVYYDLLNARRAEKV